MFTADMAWEPLSSETFLLCWHNYVLALRRLILAAPQLIVWNGVVVWSVCVGSIKQWFEHGNKELSRLQYMSPGTRVAAMNINLVEFVYLVSTRMPGDSYRWRLSSLLLCSCTCRTLPVSRACYHRGKAMSVSGWVTLQKGPWTCSQGCLPWCGWAAIGVGWVGCHPEKIQSQFRGMSVLMCQGCHPEKILQMWSEMPVWRQSRSQDTVSIP